MAKAKTKTPIRNRVQSQPNMRETVMSRGNLRTQERFRTSRLALMSVSEFAPQGANRAASFRVALPVEHPAARILARRRAVGAHFRAVRGADQRLAGHPHVILTIEVDLQHLRLLRKLGTDIVLHLLHDLVGDRRQAVQLEIGALIAPRRAIEPALAALIVADVGETVHVVVVLTGQLDVDDVALARELVANRVLKLVLLAFDRA